MGYDIGWQVEGTRALNEGEVAEVAAHVAKWRDQIVGYDLHIATTAQSSVQACYSLRPTASEDDDEDDTGGYAPGVVETLFTALGELQKLLAGFEVRVEDDFSKFVWDGTGFKKARGAKFASIPADSTQWPPISKR